MHRALATQSHCHSVGYANCANRVWIGDIIILTLSMTTGWLAIISYDSILPLQRARVCMFLRFVYFIKKNCSCKISARLSTHPERCAACQPNCARDNQPSGAYSVRLTAASANQIAILGTSPDSMRDV